MNSSSANSPAPRTSEYLENLKILQQIPFFAGFPIEALKVFAYLGVRQVFREGESLFNQDENDGQAFYILSGKARLVRQYEDDEAVLGEYGEGVFFGGLSLIGDAHRLFSMKAVSDVTCLILSREKCVKAMEQFPDVTRKILDNVIEGICSWEERFLLGHAKDCDECKQRAGISLL